MNTAEKLIKYFTDSDYRFLINGSHGFYHNISDEKYLKKMFKIKMGYELNLDNPQTFNEKLQWLKLHDRKPIYTTMVDKIEAKKKLEKSLKRNYYWSGREWPYKNVNPKIFAEQYMVDESGYELKDYKFFCFNGKCKLMFIATDRNEKTETCFDFYDENFNHLPFTNGHTNSKKILEKPKKFTNMINLAEKLSKKIPHVRIDFYNINGEIKFGEMTFYHWSGFVKFNPAKWDYTLGSWIKLPMEEQ